MISNFNLQPLKIIKGKKKPVYFFEQDTTINIDKNVVASFGEEWLKFNNFSEEDIIQVGNDYFDILDNDIINKDTYVLDMGCGSGRFSKYLSQKVGFIEAMDPSEAVWAAENLLKDIDNVRMINASADTIPFDDNTFDLVMSIGVLHHIPDTHMAMKNCVNKVKPGGYFFVYLYYNLDNKGFLSRLILKLVSLLRKLVSSMPSSLKKITCDSLALLIYMPQVILGKIFDSIGLKRLSKLLPLSYYQDKSFFIIRNDALDRFGTQLEHRFSRVQIQTMMQQCGLTDIIFSEKKPYWHAIGKKSK